MALPHLIPVAFTDAILRLDPIEIEILNFRGAFNLPPKPIQDELVDLYFRWVAPILPVIHRTDFLARYRDPENPPSLLLLQAIFLTVSRISNKLEIGDNHGTSARTFFQRAKALYDAGYEQDPVTIVQSLILMSWYWHGPQDGTENGLFFWSRLAIAVAQDADMHRSAELSHLTQSELRLRKRIWWTLFTRDRAVGAAYGRPVSICVEQSNVESITADDFIEDDKHPPNPKHVQFFLQYVELCKVLELAVCRPIRRQEDSQAIRAGCEFELSKWLLNCPEEMQWQQSHHDFWPAVLHSSYNTILCQLYGLQSVKLNSIVSQTVVSEAASMILSTVESLVSHGQIQFAPPSVLYSVFTVLVTVKDQLSSAIPSLVLQSQRKVKTCLQILKLLSKTWPIARIIGETSELVFSEKRFNEMLEVATKSLQREEENATLTSKRIFKRSLLNPKQARPEFMLPRSRIILRMVLANRSSQQTPVGSTYPLPYPTQPSQPSLPLQDPSILCPTSTQINGEAATANSNSPESTTDVSHAPSINKSKITQCSVTPPNDPLNVEEELTCEPMIPLFGKGNWSYELDHPVADLPPTIEGDSSQDSSTLDEELLLPESVDFEDWGAFLGATDMFEL